MTLPERQLCSRNFQALDVHTVGLLFGFNKSSIYVCGLQRCILVSSQMGVAHFRNKSPGPSGLRQYGPVCYHLPVCRVDVPAGLAG